MRECQYSVAQFSREMIEKALVATDPHNTDHCIEIDELQKFESPFVFSLEAETNSDRTIEGEIHCTSDGTMVGIITIVDHFADMEWIFSYGKGGLRTIDNLIWGQA
ncbi:MAG: hypothetical protein WCG01_03460 [bacterium]